MTINYLQNIQRLNIELQEHHYNRDELFEFRTLIQQSEKKSAFCPPVA